MNILVVGGGGREHAIVWKLSQSRKVDKLWCTPGNGGIASLAECLPYQATDLDSIVAWCRENRPDLVMVAPDDPLAMGLVDKLEEAGIRAFGPHANAAIIEASKSFAKELMQKYNIPTAKYAVFENEAEAIAYIEKEGAPIVVKADGLALGKGVTVATTVEQAVKAVRDAMGGAFGAAGARVVIEECLTGPEATVLCFTDGKTIIPMPTSQDHKRAYDHDEGPNTGGMGAFTPSRVYTPEIGKYCMEHIFRPTIDAMAKEGRPFKGVLYFGLMLTADGPKVIEYNARFGDPETQVILPMLKSDLVDIFEACIDGTLDKCNVEWFDGGCACIVMASGGYPGKYEKGYKIDGLGKVPSDVAVFHAGTKRVDDTIVTAGGRVLGVTCRAENLDTALAHAYAGVKEISFKDAHFRTDIGIK